jgi:hypothetical protein
MPRVAFSFGIALAVVLASGRGARADDFTPLLRGDSPDQFTLVKLGPEAIAIDAGSGEVRLTGKPNGYFATRAAYHNYALRFEWKYDRPDGLVTDAAFRGNSGVLFHIAGPHQVWPRCIEAQLMNADAGNLLAVSGARLHASKDAAAQRKAIRPVGAWNLMETTCHDGSIVTAINGVEIARGRMAEPDRGTIGWQSEGTPIRFRKLEIRADDGEK